MELFINFSAPNYNTISIKFNKDGFLINLIGIYIKAGTSMDDSLAIPSGNVIIIGDMNARSASFGDSCSNRAGTALKTFMDARSLTLLNINDKYTYHRLSGDMLIYSKLDLAFASRNLLSKGFRAYTLPEIASDHLPLAISQGPSPPPIIVNTTKYEHADWAGFADAVSERLINAAPVVAHEGSVDEAIRALTTSIQEAKDMHMKN